MTRYRKDDSKTRSLSQTIAVQDVTPPTANPALEPGDSPPRKHRIKEEVKVWPKETYAVIYRSKSDDNPDEGATLTV